MLQKISSHLNLNTKAKLFRSAFLYSEITNFIQKLLLEKFPDIPIENLPKIQIKEELNKLFVVTLVANDSTFLAFLKTEVVFFEAQIHKFLIEKKLFPKEKENTVKVIFRKK